MENENQKIILKKVFYIYSKYLNIKKRLYFLKYHLIAKKLSFLCPCKCTCISPNFVKKYDSISLYKDSFQNNIGVSFIEKNINYNKNRNYKKYSITPKELKNNINHESFFHNKEIQNKSAYSNYINLNKSQFYYYGDDIGNISSFKINNFNNSMYVNNKSKSNSKDKKYIVRIKLSNNRSIPNFYHKINPNNNENNPFIIAYSNNNIPNNGKKIFSEKDRFKHYSYKNIRIPNKLNNNQNLLRTNYFSHKNFKNPNKEIITDKIYDIRYRNSPNQKKEINYINTKLIDQQILEYLNGNLNEKENIIKKMKSQRIEYNKININPNINNKDKIINLNNLNNYSYINNNYNYYCSNSSNNTNHNSLFSRSNNYEYNNLNYTYNNINDYYSIPFQEKNRNKNNLYSNYLKKRVKRFENKNYPLRINYSNENINMENIKDSEPTNSKNEEKTKNLKSSRTSNNLIKIDYFNQNYYDNSNGILSPDTYKIPIAVPKKSLSPSKTICNKIDRNIIGNIKYKNVNKNNKNIVVDHYDTDRTLSSNYTLNGGYSMKKMYKNKKYKNKISKNVINNKKLNKNIIQKSLNLFFKNENENTMNEKIFTNNNVLNINESKKNSTKDKKGKIAKIPSCINHKNKNLVTYNSKNNNTIKSNKSNVSNVSNISNKSKKLKVTSNVINEQFNKDKKEKKEKKESGHSEKESESLRFSVQSMNDSKMMELANKMIADENLNKEEIIEILNSKKENNKE